MALKGKQVTKPDLSQALQVEHLKCIDVRSNHKKLYSAYLLPDGSIYAEACREGEQVTPYLYQRGDKFFGASGFQSLIAEKLSPKKNYKRVDVAETGTVAIDWDKLGRRGADIRSEIGLIEQRFRPVASYTDIEFKPELGVFVTQQGAITARVVEEAQGILEQIHTAIRQRSYAEGLVERYMTLIPVKASRSGLSNILGTQTKIHEQQQLLGVLTVCLRDLESLGNSLRQAVRSQSRELFDQEALSVFVMWGDPEKANSNAGQDHQHLSFEDLTVGVSW